MSFDTREKISSKLIQLHSLDDSKAFSAVLNTGRGIVAN